VAGGNEESNKAEEDMVEREGGRRDEKERKGRR
jgi:hypothetical protein